MCSLMEGVAPKVRLHLSADAGILGCKCILSNLGFGFRGLRASGLGFKGLEFKGSRV